MEKKLYDAAIKRLSEGEIIIAINTIDPEGVDEFLNKIKFRFNKNRDNFHNGLISLEQKQIEENKIYNSVIDYLKNTQKGNIKQEKNKFWKSFLLFTILFLLGLSSKPLFFYISGANNINDSSSPDSARILILSFNPYKDCVIEKTSYEQYLIDRYTKIAKEENIKLSIFNMAGSECPKSQIQAREICLREKMDLVIWGKYFEECENNNIKLNIQFTGTNKFSGSTSDTLSSIISLEQLTEGYLQEEIDYQIFQALRSRLIVFSNDKEFKDITSKYFNLFKISLKYYRDRPDLIKNQFLSIYVDFARLISDTFKYKKIKYDYMDIDAFWHQYEVLYSQEIINMPKNKISLLETIVFENGGLEILLDNKPIEQITDYYRIIHTYIESIGKNLNNISPSERDLLKETIKNYKSNKVKYENLIKGLNYKD